MESVSKADVLVPSIEKNSNETNEVDKYTVEGLSAEQRLLYDSLLARQPELRKISDEWDKKGCTEMKIYSVVENGNKSSLEDSSIS